MNSDDVPSLEEFTGIYNFSVHVTENNGGSGLIKSSFGVNE